MRLGFIGLGAMGAGMAANLQRAGLPLTVHARRREAAERFLAAGAAWAATPAELAARCDAVFTCLPGPHEMEAVATGPQGLLEGMAAGSALFDMTTNSVATVRRLHAVFAARGAFLLDAPVSGGPRGAANARLAIWVGGDAQAYARFEPALRAMADQPRHLGAIGAGTIAKLVNNCSTYVITCALAETFSLGVKAGADPLALWEAVRGGALGRRRTFDGMIDQVLPGRYEPAAFALQLARKDVALALELAAQTGVPMALAGQTLSELDQAVERGWGDRDARAVTLVQQERAGISIRVDGAALAEVLERDPPAAGDPKHA